MRQLLGAEFEYAEGSSGPAEPPAAVDPTEITLPTTVWEELSEAADRFSITRLEKALVPLEQDGEAHRRVAACLRQWIQEGDLDQVSAFLEKVNKE